MVAVAGDGLCALVGFGTFRLLLQGGDTVLDAVDLRVVVRQGPTLERDRVRPPAALHIRVQVTPLLLGQVRAPFQGFVLAVVCVDGLHALLCLLPGVQLGVQLLNGVFVVRHDAAHAGALDAVQNAFDMLEFLPVFVSCGVLLLLLADGEVARPGNHDGRHPGVDLVPVVDVLGQLPGVGVQQLVDLRVVLRADAALLRFGDAGGSVAHIPVFRRCRTLYVVGPTVGVLRPSGGFFADAVVLHCVPFLACLRQRTEAIPYGHERA